MATTAVRPYDALNGEELRKVIVDDALARVRALLEKALAEEAELSLAVAFPVIRNLKFTLTFEAYPSYADLGKKAIGAAVIGPPAPAGKKPLEVKVSGGLKNVGETVPPDQLRMEHGLPLSSPAAEHAARAAKESDVIEQGLVDAE